MAVKRTVPVIHAETQDYKTDILVDVSGASSKAVCSVVTQTLQANAWVCSLYSLSCPSQWKFKSKLNIPGNTCTGLCLFQNVKSTGYCDIFFWKRLLKFPITWRFHLLSCWKCSYVCIYRQHNFSKFVPIINLLCCPINTFFSWSHIKILITNCWTGRGSIILPSKQTDGVS